MRKKIIAVVLVAAVALGAVVWALLRGPSQGTKETLPEDDQQELTTGDIYYNGIWYSKKKNLETILLLGVDKFEEDITAEDSYVNSQQADFLLLIVCDRKTGECSALQLNRDTMTEITMLGIGGKETGTKTAQLALAHTYGSGDKDSCENTVKAVSNLLYGIRINDYASITMDAVAVINDMAGGVTVTVMDDMTALDPVLEEGASVTLSGSQALTYVRARQNVADGTNIHRMERQRQYMLALWKQVSQRASADDSFLMEMTDEISPYLVTSCTASELSDLYDRIAGLDLSEIMTVDGENVLGDEYYEFYVDEDALQQLVLQLFYDPVEADDLK